MKSLDRVDFGYKFEAECSKFINAKLNDKDLPTRLAAVQNVKERLVNAYSL